MNFPLTSQDELSFSADGTYTMGTATGDTSRSDDQILTHYEPTMPWYGEPQSLNSLGFNEPLFPTFFEPSNQVAAEHTPSGQPTPTSAFAPSSSTQNLSTNVLAITAVAPASTTAPPTPATNVTTQHRFGCPLCPKTFDRRTRAEACHNEHLEWKPHVCQGACGNAACNAAYGSIENLHRHLRVPAKRKEACPYCARSFLKQNISRHKKSCM